MFSPITMKSVPPFMRSCLNNAMRLACKIVAHFELEIVLSPHVVVHQEGWSPVKG